MCDEPIIKIENLSKRFIGVRALNNVDLQIHAGHIVGVLGANGGGKSTLLRHMIGMYLPDEGCCTTFGRPAAKLSPAELARIGYVHQEGELIDWMTVEQLIRYVASYYPTWNMELEKQYRKEFSISEERRVGSLSPGQRQMLAILLAIGFEPELLILDEPAAALDPMARSRFLDLLLTIIQDPKRTILISSHILSDVEKVIDHVVILNKGRIITDMAFDDLKEEYTRLRLSSLDGPLPDELPFSPVIDCEKTETEAVFSTKNTAAYVLEEKADALRCSLEMLPLALEDLYRLIVEAESKGA